MEKHVVLSGVVLALALVGSACGLSFDEVEPDCEGWRPGDVVITELLPDPAGADTGQEWMELHNPGSSAVDLKGLLLYAARVDGSQERAYLFEESMLVEARGYGVLGDVRVEQLPVHVNHSYGDTLGSLGNTGGLIGLRCGDVVVDEVRYAGPIRSGVARIYDGRLVPDALDNDDTSHWCDAPAPGTGSGPRASPGTANPPCANPLGGADGGVSADAGVIADAGVPGDTCQSPGTSLLRSVSRPGPGDLVITEVMADPKAVADAQGEWVEVHALRDVDLNGVLLSDESGGGTPLNDKQCLEVRGGTPVVLARSREPSTNGGVRPVLATFSFGLSNSAGTHALRLSLNGGLLDEVTWTGAALPGVSRQLDPARKDALRNDVAGSFCSTPEGVLYNAVDRGTPGAENRPCAP
ncbi:lamin tail domain-containing protein [Archangium violaceum]|uniref:lamin tail domain-containing protein n=1 Tax=Archangium violaceum TaxID=83451 RepID=UPI00195219CF|nr:lamin tail domain-containing protein [Archangium violaceum]QRN96384.1 lamin tail domain-containing protein [Archangium violaceum]